MCFYKASIIDKKHRIADDDIVCYKVVKKISDTHWKSIYYNYHYYKTVGNGHANKPTDIEKLDKKYALEGGVFHSYSELKTAIDDLIWADSVVVKCIIPKGTPYWQNQLKKEYASIDLTVMEEINID
jgi:hypothetical protein